MPLPAQVQLRDAGHLVRSFRPATRELAVPHGTLPTGLYLLMVAGQPPVRIEFR